MKKCYVALGAFLLLTACSSKVDFETMSAEEIYNYAMDEMEKTRYSKAETAFETLETDHPYSQWAVRSKLMSAYAYYKDEKYDDAVMAADRFIKYHPGNKDVPYALYLKGMCYYDQISSADKDQGNTQKAAETFALLMALYPDSEYAKDAAGKMNLTEDYKAGQEMIIGRYYLHEGNYLSALNRFNVVLENYQQTIQIEEALYRQVEIYAIFGLNNYANGYFKILQQNYPEGKWTAKAEKIMKKIGVEVQPSKAKATPKKEQPNKEQPQKVEEESKGWFSGWFGGSEDKAEEVKAKSEEVKANVEETAEAVTAEPEKASEATAETTQVVKKESAGWFSGWFGGSDDDKVEEVKAKAEETIPEAQDEGKGWFSGWFGGSEDKAEEVKTKAAENQATEVTDAIKEVSDSAKRDAQAAKSKSNSWFSGWVGNNQDRAGEMKAYVEEPTESLKPVMPQIESKVEEIPETVVEVTEVAEPVQESLPEAQEESKGWFSGWFGGSDDDKVEEVTATVEETIPEAQEESAGWFSGWFGGSDDDKVEEVTATVEETIPEAREESKGWFSGWFGGSDDDKVEEVTATVEETIPEAQEESKGWFSGWFGGTEISEDMAQSKKAANDAINETLDGASDDTLEVLDDASENADELLEATEDVAEETSETVDEHVEKAEQKSSWFSGLFSGGTLMGDGAAE